MYAALTIPWWGGRSGWDMLAYKGVDVKRLQSLREFADIHDDVAARLDVEGVVRAWVRSQLYRVAESVAWGIRR